MHQWRYAELRRRTVFVPKRFSIRWRTQSQLGYIVTSHLISSDSSKRHGSIQNRMALQTK